MYAVRFYTLGFIFGTATIMTGAIFGSGWSLGVCVTGFVLCGMFDPRND